MEKALVRRAGAICKQGDGIAGEGAQAPEKRLNLSHNDRLPGMMKKRKAGKPKNRKG